MILDSKKIVQNTNNDTVAFEEVLAIIERARVNAFCAVNREFISMYWEIGRYVSKKDDAVVEYALSRSMLPALIAEYLTHLLRKLYLQTNYANYVN